MTRSVFPTMGTMASVTVSDADDARLGEAAVQRAVARARTVLEQMDRRFSHYSAMSEISTWISGGVVSPDALGDIQHVLRRCAELKADSDGIFTIDNPSTGAIDTAGYVKGYAIGLAAKALSDAGVENAIVTVGGDSACLGRASEDRPWRMAVADPRQPRSIASIVELQDAAIATSGAAERGDHIWIGERPVQSDVLSFTVVGPDIALADAYATVGFAMGEAGIAWVARHEGYRSMVVRPDGSIAGDAALVSAA